MAQRTSNWEETVESNISKFEKNRDMIAAELLKLKQESLNIIETSFGRLDSELVQKAGKLDMAMDSSIEELKELLSKKRELESFMEKINPVLGLAHDLKQRKSSYLDWPITDSVQKHRSYLKWKILEPSALKHKKRNAYHLQTNRNILW